MGIANYFSFLVKNYPHIIKKYVKDVLKVDNLYLDCNSIIYDTYSKMKKRTPGIQRLSPLELNLCLN